MSRQLSILPFLATADLPTSGGGTMPTYPKTSYKRFAGPHTSFPQFVKLPVEIRTFIWQLTLQPRVVAIDFLQARGFGASVSIPVSLQVNQDSRAAMLPFYPLCFGNLVHPPQIRFNFSLDTLYIQGTAQPWVLPLLASMTKAEYTNLQRFAVAEDIDEIEYTRYPSEYEVVQALEKAVPLMTSLQVFQVAHPLDCGYDPTAPFHFYTDFPESHIHNCDGFYGWLEDHVHDDVREVCDQKFPKEECDCYFGPDLPNSFERIAAPKMQVIWAWRGIEPQKQT
jgi:hypothetical protein